MTNDLRFYCTKCKKSLEYNTKTYGGQSTSVPGNYCKKHWTELMEMLNRHAKELNEWQNAK